MRHTLLAALAIALAWCAPTAATAQTTALFFDSQPGDYVGAGQQWMYTQGNATFQARFQPSSNGNGAIIVSVNDGHTYWSMEFGAPGGVLPQVGAYELATRWPFTSFAAMDVGGDGRGCNQLFGRFLIREVVYGGNDTINALAVDFEQHCEDADPGLFGAIRYNSSVSSTTPFDGAYPSYLLHVTVQANGAVTGSGIDCGPAGPVCDVRLLSPATLELTATPNPGYFFAGWTGGCHGGLVISVHLNFDKSCSAQFLPMSSSVPLTLALFNSQPGEWLGQGHREVYAPQNSKWTVVSTNDLQGPGNGLRVSIKSVDDADEADWFFEFRARFNQVLTSGTYTFASSSGRLNASVQSRACGSTTSDPGGFVVQELEVVSGIVIRAAVDFTIHCSALPGAAFAGSIRYNSAVAPRPALSVVVTGSGDVVFPSGARCPPNCDQAFQIGSQVSLLQSPVPGWAFSGWSGDPDCSDGDVTMIAPISCGATFAVAVSAVSVSPSSGSAPPNVPQVFAALYSDATNAQNISLAYLRVSTNATGATNSCMVRYDRVQKLMSLRDDAGNWLPGATFASGIVQQNSQCSVAFGSSSAFVSGQTLTLTVSLTFTPSYVGAKKTYLNVTSAAGTTTGWQQRGTWGVAPVMTLGPLTPAAGSGYTELFRAEYGDSAGWMDFAALFIKFGTTPNGGANTCMVRYDAAAPYFERLSLRDDAGNWQRQQPYHATIENSQCALNLGDTAVALDTYGMTFFVKVTFKTPYVGQKNVYLQATSYASGNTGWQQVGTYTVTPPPPPGPVLTLGPVSPNAGSSAPGIAQSFYTQFTDAIGLADLAYAFVRFSNLADPNHDCVVRYDWRTLRFSLRDDLGNWQPATQFGPQHNAQCTVSGGSVSIGTTSIGFELRVAFKAAYAGDKTISLRATRMDGTNTGWIPSGTWTVLASAISADSVTPNSGSGLDALFTSTFSHAAGVSSLSLLYVKIHTAPSGAANTCMIRYDRASQLASLRADNGTWMPATPLGSSGTVQQNSQCTVDFRNSSASSGLSGQSLVLTTRITFSPAFAGDKNIYLQATSVFGESTGWQQRGTWTVPTGP